MTRNKKLEVRLTNEEVNCLENICNKNSITKSEFIRHAINGYSQNANINTKKIAKHVCVMQGVVNKIIDGEDTENDLYVLNEEMKKIWQYL